MTKEKTETQPETSKKLNVHEAISAAMADISKLGIAKDRKNAQQGYNFRGIDEVYNALAPVLSSHGLFICPIAQERNVTERQTKSGNVIFYTTLKVDFEIYAADGSSIRATTYGEAMDSGDKSTNKAMSAAYKYLCLQLFCIPTEGDNDADATTHEVVAAPIQTPAPKKQIVMAEEQLEKYRSMIAEAQNLEELKNVWSNIAVTPYGKNAKLVELKDLRKSQLLSNINMLNAG